MNMCQLMEHTVNNMIVAAYVCVERLTPHICTHALNEGRPIHRYNCKDVLATAYWCYHPCKG